VARSQRHELIALAVKEWVSGDDYHASPLSDEIKQPHLYQRADCAEVIFGVFRRAKAAALGGFLSLHQPKQAL
jgi:hypothetical protein